MLKGWCCLGILTNVLEISEYKKLQNWLTYYGSTMLIMPAVIFNFLSFVILMSMSRTSTSFYMKSLCIFDTLTIFSKFLHESIVTRNQIREHPLPFGSVFCKLEYFAESLLAMTSIYILIAMSFDKLVCVMAPLKASVLLTTRNARIVCTLIVACSMAFGSFHLFMQQVRVLHSGDLDIKVLTSVQDDMHISNYVKTLKTHPMNRIVYDCDSKWPGMLPDLKRAENIMRVFIPIILLLVINISTLIAFKRTSKQTSKILCDSTGERVRSKKNCVLRWISTSKRFNQQHSMELTDKKPNLNNVRKTCCHAKRSKTHSHHVLIMIFSVCFGFIVLNLPFALTCLIERKKLLVDYLYHNDNSFSIDFNKTDIIQAVHYEFFAFMSHFLLDLNYVANFFIFFLSGSNFRAQLLSKLSFLKCNLKTNSMGSALTKTTNTTAKQISRK